MKKKNSWVQVCSIMAPGWLIGSGDADLPPRLCLEVAPAANTRCCFRRGLGLSLNRCTGKETARGHFAKKSSSKQSKSRLFSDPGGQQPSTRGSGQTEVRKGNMVRVWGGGWEEKYDSVHPAAQLLKQCCLP